MSLQPITVIAFQELAFAGPLLIAATLLHRFRHQPRMLVAALFSFLYLGGVLLALQALNLQTGWWTFSHATMALLGVPAQIWLGWALTLGPVLFLAFPSISPLWLFLPLVLLDYWLMPSLAPFVDIGPDWLSGKVVVLLLAYLPAQYLARWTAADTHLGLRASLLAVAHGCVAYLVIPTAIFKAMGGRWDFSFLAWPSAVLLVLAVVALLCLVLGLAAVQLFVVHGAGTPIPLDHTHYLVRCGLYAYLSNPMQLCTALSWLLMGLALHSLWIALAAVMAWVFVRGLVRWHHRHDLALRFPLEWREYMQQVPAWLPRWTPWVYAAAPLTFDPGCRWHVLFVGWLRSRSHGLVFDEQPGASLGYTEPDRQLYFAGPAAVAKSLDHVNLIWSLLAAALLLVVLPLQALRQFAHAPTARKIVHER